MSKKEYTITKRKFLGKIEKTKKEWVKFFINYDPEIRELLSEEEQDRKFVLTATVIIEGEKILLVKTLDKVFYKSRFFPYYLCTLPDKEEDKVVASIAHKKKRVKIYSAATLLHWRGRSIPREVYL